MAGKLKTTVTVGGQSKTFISVPVATRLPSGQTVNQNLRPTTSRLVQSQINADIAELLMGNLFENEVTRKFIRDQRIMARQMEQAAKAELGRLIPMITRTLMHVNAWGAEDGEDEAFNNEKLEVGMRRPKGPYRPRFPLEGYVDWQGLNEWYLNKRKKRPYFFQNQGHLLKAIQGAAKSYPAALGGVKITKREPTKADFKKMGKEHGARRRRHVLGTIDVQIFPQAPRGMLPGLSSGRWSDFDAQARLEQSGFIPIGADQREKLRGAYVNRPGQARGAPMHRPLFTPVTQFWAMHRIPTALAEALSRTNRIQRR